MNNGGRKLRGVAVIGVGMTKFGELWDRSLRDLAVEASLKAIDDAGVDKIDSIYVGNNASGQFNAQEHLAPLIAEYLGVTPAPATKVESACASGGLAVRQGFIEVASGISDVVLVVGVEKMVDGTDATSVLATDSDQEYEAYNGVTFPALYALIARRHMYEYGTTREQLACVAVKNHKNGAKNPYAQYRREIAIDEVLSSPMVADPLRLLDCSPVSDGAAAIVLCPVDMATRFKGEPVRIIGSGQATDTLALHNRRSITTLQSVIDAAKKAYKMANLKPEDIDVAEVHDCFTISEICIIEDLGFVKKGEGGKAVEEGLTGIEGKIPVNPSGGLKSKGHPVGATGVAQIVEIVEQLRGKCGDRQVKDAKIGLTQNMGGSGASCVVHVLKVM